MAKGMEEFENELKELRNKMEDLKDNLVKELLKNEIRKEEKLTQPWCPLKGGVT